MKVSGYAVSGPVTHSLEHLVSRGLAGDDGKHVDVDSVEGLPAHEVDPEGEEALAQAHKAEARPAWGKRENADEMPTPPTHAYTRRQPPTQNSLHGAQRVHPPTTAHTENQQTNRFLVSNGQPVRIGSSYSWRQLIPSGEPMAYIADFSRRPIDLKPLKRSLSLASGFASMFT